MVQDKRHQDGFTLIELTVVLAVMCLLALTAIPTIEGMLSSGSDAQAYNIVVSTLYAARAEAMQSGQYVAVHFERGSMVKDNWVPNPPYSYSHPDNGDTYWVGVLIYDPTDGFFKPHPTYAPRKMPGTIAIGEVRGTFVSDGTFKDVSTTDDLSDDNYRDFTTFSIVFNPAGNVVKLVDGAPIKFANVVKSRPYTYTDYNGVKQNVTVIDWPKCRILFEQDVSAQATIGGGQQDFNQAVLWKQPTNTGHDLEAGAVALTLFDWKAFRNDANRNAYLGRAAQVIAINMYTGQLAPRK
jgi:prepilin-type N-terminal cleavage/methylation domain-containing protein